MFSSNIPALKPTKITASVAAALEPLKPKISCRCALEYLNISCVNQAAIHLLERAIIENVPAIIRAVGPLKITLTSTNIPTLIRKNGINKEFPINSILFIRADDAGMSLFNANPATNAPIIGSNPAISAKNAAKKTIESTKI